MGNASSTAAGDSTSASETYPLLPPRAELTRWDGARAFDAPAESPPADEPDPEAGARVAAALASNDIEQATRELEAWRLGYLRAHQRDVPAHPQYAKQAREYIHALTATATKLVQAWRKPAASARARSAADWAAEVATELRTALEAHTPLSAELVNVVTWLRPPRKLAALAPLLLRARAVSDAARRLAQLARSLDSGLWPTVAAAAKIANAEEIVSDLAAEFDSAAAVLAQLADRVPVLRCDAAHVVALEVALRLRGIAVAVEAEPNA